MTPEVREAAIRDLAQYVGMQIRLRRVALRMTLDELADKTGVSKATLSLVENGKTDVKLSTIAVIRSVLALDVSVGPIGIDVGEIDIPEMEED